MSGILPDIRLVLSVPLFYTLYQNIAGANAMRRRFLKERVRITARSRVLEIGCGPGTNIEHLEAGVEYVGCDISRRYIETARKKYGNRGTFICASVSEVLCLNPGDFDHVLAIGILHHLEDRDVMTLCQESTRLLRNGGQFVSLDPCWKENQSLLDRLVVKMDRGKFVRRPEEYSNLVKKTFPAVKISMMDTRDLRFPASNCILEAWKQPGQV